MSSKIYQAAEAPSYPLECYFRGNIKYFIEGEMFKTTITELEFIDRKNLVDYVEIGYRYLCLIWIFAYLLCKKDNVIMHYKFSVYLGFIYISQIFVLIVRVPKVWRLSIYIDRFAKRVMDTNNRNCLSSIDIADNGFMLASIYQNVFSVLYGVQIIYLIATCVSLSRKFSLVFHVKNWKNMELMYAEEDPRRAAYLKRNKR